MSDSVIRIRGLRKKYGPHVALDGVDLDIGTGGVGILGPKWLRKINSVQVYIGADKNHRGRRHSSWKRHCDHGLEDTL